ncbi:hypothetical protein NSK_005541 [Nannochloropsis salina CCMP1776]|uniref:PNPLA domain-containing protein n=1 Tax=Nannochloropsis salina CCMP1776 TaxID=1027361 RepID=A0A4D9CV73_9STRA|nr:hypothetical protein NSK_005541 [Nannochloropsis salina CCMP1776]|eukprot:TFJ83152.1 hypothetical protein NSK_005541 [Nannochloropsis salina CCMP1776]
MLCKGIPILSLCAIPLLLIIIQTDVSYSFTSSALFHVSSSLPRYISPRCCPPSSSSYSSSSSSFASSSSSSFASSSSSAVCQSIYAQPTFSTTRNTTPSSSFPSPSPSSFSPSPSSSFPSPSFPAPTLSFPGGGIFFYWQAGAVHYLQHHFDLGQATLVGASAGALTAVLAGCAVSMPAAAERALALSMSISLWQRPLGLAGVWGGLVREWLDELLPQDAAERCQERVQLYVNLLDGQALFQDESRSLTFCSEASPFLSPLRFPSLASSFLPTPLQASPSVLVGSRTSKADTTF